MKLKKVFLSELQPADYNPRTDLQPDDPEYQAIKRSIEEFGYVEPIIVNSDYTVIGGHQRVKVLKDLGKVSVDVIVIDLDKTREKALNVALNKITGSWDMEKLSRVMEDLKLTDFDLTFTGFTQVEIDGMLAEPVNLDDFFEKGQHNSTKKNRIVKCPHCGEEFGI